MTTTHRIRKILLLVFLILIVGGLLVLALLSSDDVVNDENFIPAETIYTILVAALLLIILMIFLVFAQARQRVIVRPVYDKNVIDEREEPVQAVVQQPTVIKVETESSSRKID